MNDSSRRGGARDTLNRRLEKDDTSNQIASKLKALYQAVENEPVPQRLIDLLGRLDEAEKAQSRD